MWPNPQFSTFTEEIYNGKIHFLCSENKVLYFWKAYFLHFIRNAQFI